MLLKVLIVAALAGLLFETIAAGKAEESDENVSFSVTKIWQSYTERDECTCGVDDDWKEGVQECYDGCKEASLKFRGPSFDMADTAVKGFEILLTKLIYFTNSNSTVLASSSHAMLESISKCNRLEGSGFTIIKEYNKVVLRLIGEFNDVVTKLSDIIGELTCPVSDAISDLGFAHSKFFKAFIRSGITGFRKKVDYEPVLKKFQKLMNTVALIAETLLNGCDSATSEVHEAVTVLTLIVDYFLVSVHGMNSCYQSTLYEQQFIVPKEIELCSISYEYALVEITQAIQSVVFPFAASITALLTTLVNVTMFLNTVLKDILGIFEGVTITVAEITKNLSKSVKSTVSAVTKGLSKILKGVVPK